MNKYYSSLEIDVILDKIKNYIHTENGLNLLNKQFVFTNYYEFTKENHLLSDYMDFSVKYGNLPIVNSSSFIDEVKYMEKGGTGRIETFQAIYKETKMIGEIVSILKPVLKDYEALKLLCENLQYLPGIIGAIDNIFDPEFLIKDSASPELKEIRKKLRKLENSLKTIILKEMNKHKDNLIDISYSIRNGNFVLPVKTSSKNKVKGLIMDVSDSQETTFIQPEECLVASNEIQRLRIEESEEIKKILEELSAKIASYSNVLISNNEILSKLDLLNAKYLYSREINGVVIQTFNDSSLNIKLARHPLIDPEKVIANSLKMDNFERQLIVSGPNAGGKSVFLKLIGLLVLMNQLIIPLPLSEDSTIGFFHHIYIDIGDVQSIEENLSTFSGHISNVNTILNKVNQNDLVLIDELGTGTDPKEGEALAIAICKYLRDKGCKSLITSHFEGVKRYALSNKEVLCGSMEFDEDTLTPKYKLLLGVPGKSYALFISKKYGINKDVIKDAQSYINSHKIEGETDYVDVLTRSINEYNELIEKNKREYSVLKNNEKEYKNKINELEKKLSKFNEDMIIEREKIISETREKLENLKKTILENGTVKLHEVIEAENDLEAMIEPQEEKYVGTAEFSENIEVGDYVKSTVFGIEGKVVSITKRGCLVVTNSGSKYTVQKDNLVKTEEKKKTTKVEIKNGADGVILSQSIPFELNIIGLHVDEALDELDLYIDKAIMAHRKSFKIIHGFGTGALRKAVWEYLKNCKYVKEFNYGGEFDGGMGSTNVTLK